MRESLVEKKLRQHAEALGGYAWKLTAWTGVPDRLIILPGGFTGFAEVKKPKGGVVSKLQKHRIEELHERGHVVGIVWTPDHIKPLIHRVLTRDVSTLEEIFDVR